MNSICVITTIQSPTAPIRQWEAIFGDRLIVIGDRKSPSEWACGKARYFSLDAQNRLPLESLKFTPENHYARKNIGYLQAMLYGAQCIYDTDDDNAPTPHWREREEECICEGDGVSGTWINAYQLFSKKHIWPRGFPLNLQSAPSGDLKPAGRTGVQGGRGWRGASGPMACPIQQGLANGDPDVDAVWRLVIPSEVRFAVKRSVAIMQGAWTPFNSQSTWWFPSAFPLMYLPIHATFRMCDIWRSFVAQRCLWAMDKTVAFHSPAEVVQDRNVHDLMKDFESELPGYIHNESIAAALEKTELKSGGWSVCENLRKCYDVMVAGGWLPSDELKSVDAWIDDVKRITTKGNFK